MGQCFRQGDVLLEAVEAPQNLAMATKKEDRILALGEQSGHAHVLTEECDLFEIEGQMFVLVNGDGAQLNHTHLPTGKLADHAPIPLPIACYRVVIQKQYNPYQKFMEQVLD